MGTNDESHPTGVPFLTQSKRSTGDDRSSYTCVSTATITTYLVVDTILPSVELGTGDDRTWYLRPSGLRVVVPLPPPPTHPLCLWGVIGHDTRPSSSGSRETWRVSVGQSTPRFDTRDVIPSSFLLSIITTLQERGPHDLDGSGESQSTAWSDTPKGREEGGCLSRKTNGKKIKRVSVEPEGHQSYPSGSTIRLW